jgi:hypothetical protein
MAQGTGRRAKGENTALNSHFPFALCPDLSPCEYISLWASPHSGSSCRATFSRGVTGLPERSLFSKVFLLHDTRGGVMAIGYAGWRGVMGLLSRPHLRLWRCDPPCGVLRQCRRRATEKSDRTPRLGPRSVCMVAHPKDAVFRRVPCPRLSGRRIVGAPLWGAGFKAPPFG